MYSKAGLRKTIERKLKAKDWSYYRLSRELGISQSNLNRALHGEAHNLTLPQFARLVQALSLSPAEVHRILSHQAQPPPQLHLMGPPTANRRFFRGHSPGHKTAPKKAK